MVLNGENVIIPLISAQLNNNFNFNWLLKKVNVGSRRVFPNTDGFTLSPDPLLGSYCNILWDENTTDFRALPTLDYSGTNQRSFVNRIAAYPPPGGTEALHYSDEYRCCTVINASKMFQKGFVFEQYENGDYVPQHQVLVRSYCLPEDIYAYWLLPDENHRYLQVTGALGYAIVIIEGDYANVKTDWDAANGISFLVGSIYNNELHPSIVDPVENDRNREDELHHSGFRTTNKLLGTFTFDGQTYSIISMTGKMSSMPYYPDYAMRDRISQPYLISNWQHEGREIPYPKYVMMLGAEYYGYQIE